MNRQTALATIAIALLTALTACPGREQHDPPANLCGNGALDPGEQCDGAELDGWTCYEAGFDAGDMQCNADCTLDTSSCISDPCWNYPCGDTGVNPGDVAEDISFSSANEAAGALDGGDGVLSFSDLYLHNEAHGGTLRGALLFVSAGWCPVCAEEAPRLNALYESLRDQGILLIGVVAEDNDYRPASLQFAENYGLSKGWTFPTVAGSPPMGFWANDEYAGALPFHLFVDLRDMRLFGRYTSGAVPKLLRFPLEELAAGPNYGANGARIIDFDCAPGSGDAEPNDYATPISGSARPFNLSGVLCPPTIEDDLETDEDVIDLGTLQAGTVIDVAMSRPTGSPTYPIFMLLRDDGSNWYQWGPGLLDTDQAGRQWVIDTTGRYVLSAFEGRIASGWYYGEISSPTADQECCEGGPEYTYSLAIGSFDLAATEAPLVVGQTRTGDVDTRNLQVFPFDASATVSHTFTLETDSAFLDPYLVLYDPVGHAVLAFDDDIDNTASNYNARVTWTPTASQTVWVVVSYVNLWVRVTTPGYRLTVQ